MKYVQRATVGLLLFIASACTGTTPSLVPAAAVIQDERGAVPAQRPAVGGGPLAEPTADPGVNVAKPAPAGAPKALKRGTPSHPAESIPPTI